jgi:photosystem II stability/assembly factor-like uncharacterized protein
MKTLFSFFLFILMNAFESYAQPSGYVDMSSKIPIAGTLVTLSDVQAVGDTLWISCSSSAVILRSTDGGNTFTSPVTASVTQAIFIFPDATNGWAVGLAKGNKTTDGGQSWITPNITIGGAIYDVYFPTNLVGYAVGNNEAIYKTENGGTSWTLKTRPANISASILSVIFPNSSDPNAGYIAASNAGSTIFKTTDGGNSWTTMTLSGITSSMNCIKFIDANTGWAAGGNGEIFWFKNGTWTKQSSPVTTSLNGISFASDGLNGWAVGNGGVILHTTNGGTTWAQEGSGLTTQNLTKVDVVSSTEAYIVGFGKTFIKYTNVTTGINNPLAESASFNLEQNYPNPFNQTTQIPYSLTVSGNVKLSVYNLLGNQVAILVDEQKPSGRHIAHFEGGYLPSGIYYYQLQLGDRIETRKMWMIK